MLILKSVTLKGCENSDFEAHLFEGIDRCEFLYNFDVNKIL